MTILEFYPHSETTVTDNTARTPVLERELPLCKPLFVFPAQSGVPNVPVYYANGVEAKEALGAQTFNEANLKYYSPATRLAIQHLQQTGCFISRAVDAKATPAVSLICMAVKVDQDIPQYEIDPVTGNYKIVTVTTTITTSDAVALNATAVPVDALTKAIPANTLLNFGTTAVPKIVNVTAQANIGATSLVIAPSTVTIASDAVATRETKEKVAIMTDDAIPVHLTLKGATVRYLALNDLVSIAEALDHTFAATTDAGKLQELLAIMTDADYPTANPLTGTTEAVIVPVALVVAKSPGAYGNDLGFTIDYSRDANSATAIAKRNGFIFDFYPFKKDYGVNTTSPIKSIFNTNYFRAAMAPECIDIATEIKYDMKAVIEDYYPSKSNNLMMDFYPIYPNINLLAAVLAPYEASIPDLDFKFYETDGTPVANIDPTDLQLAISTYQSSGMFNMFGLRDPEGLIYSRIIPLPTNEEAGFFNIGTGRYLSLGSDGDIFKKDVLQAYLIRYFNLEVVPELEDEARYPFTHIIDPGYTEVVKDEMIEMMALCPSFKLDIGVNVHPKYDLDPTADGIREAAEDISYGASLRTKALLVRECIEKGTNTCRCSIFGITGYEPGQKYPTGLQNAIAVKRAKFHNKPYLDRLIEEFPNNEVDFFESYVWLPSSNALKKLAWATGLNYCQFYDMVRKNCPALRTVYDDDTSSLSDFNIVDVVVYAKHTVRKTWAKYSGSTKPTAELQPILKKSLDNDLSYMLNNKFRFTVTPYLTGTDEALGFVQRAKVELFTNNAFRVGAFDLVCSRG